MKLTPNEQFREVAAKFTATTPISDLRNLLKFEIQLYLYPVDKTTVASALKEIPQELQVKCHFPGLQNIFEKDGQKFMRLFNPQLSIEEILQKLPKQQLENLHKFVQKALIPETYIVKYEELSKRQRLELVLTQDAIPSGCEVAGHIVHFNLSGEEQLQFKHFIGLVSLEGATRTVVNKVNPLSGQFRVLDLELLAGVPDYETTVKQNGISFTIDYSKVYWNSKLEEEHFRVCQQIANIPGDGVILDATGGVGPFSVLMASKFKQRCICNDLNESSYFYMQLNVKKNKVQELVQCQNLDAMVLLERVLIGEQSLKAVILNLPELSIEFFQVYRNIKPKNMLQNPIYHVECFSRLNTPELQKAEGALRVLVAKDQKFQESFSQFLSNGISCDSWDQAFIAKNINLLNKLITQQFKSFECRQVRDVGSNKLMLCLTFQFNK